MTLPPITRAKLAGDFVEMSELTEAEIARELTLLGTRTVWISVDDYQLGGGFRVAVLRRDSARRIHRTGTMKVSLECPQNAARSLEREPSQLDLPYCYSALTGSPVRGMGFELLPPSWFEALFRNRLTLRYLRDQVIDVLRQVVTRRPR